MKVLTGFLIALASATCVAAEAYRWVDEKGVVNYGEKPPQERRATPVDTRPGGTIETSGQFDSRQSGGPRGQAVEQPAPLVIVVPPPAPALSSVRGMEFDTYIRLQRGMSEASCWCAPGAPTTRRWTTGRLRPDAYYSIVANPSPRRSGCARQHRVHRARQAILIRARRCSCRGCRRGVGAPPTSQSLLQTTTARALHTDRARQQHEDGAAGDRHHQSPTGPVPLEHDKPYGRPAGDGSGLVSDKDLNRDGAASTARSQARRCSPAATRSRRITLKGLPGDGLDWLAAARTPDTAFERTGCSGTPGSRR
jgi:hypothetical protein